MVKETLRTEGICERGRVGGNANALMPRDKGPGSWQSPRRMYSEGTSARSGDTAISASRETSVNLGRERFRGSCTVGRETGRCWWWPVYCECGVATWNILKLNSNSCLCLRNLYVKSITYREQDLCLFLVLPLSTFPFWFHPSRYPCSQFFLWLPTWLPICFACLHAARFTLQVSMQPGSHRTPSRPNGTLGSEISHAIQIEPDIKQYLN